MMLFHSTLVHMHSASNVLQNHIYLTFGMFCAHLKIASYASRPWYAKH